MRYRDLLGQREYRLLFSGQVLSQLGDAVYEVGIVWLVYTMTHSPAMLGWLAMGQSIPFLVFGLLAGAYADRWDRRVTMLVSDLVRGLAVLYLLLRYWFGELSVWEVLAVTVLLTTARSFFHPSMRAIYPQLLPREALLHANSLSESAKRICKVGGMMLGGVLMAQGQAEVMLGVNAGSFLVSFVTIWLIRVPRGEQAEPVKRRREKGKQEGSVLSAIFLAAREIASDRTVLFAIVLSSLGLIVSAGMIKIGLPLLAGDVLASEGDVYGLLMACFSVGMFASAASMGKLARFSVPLLVVAGWTVYGLTYLGLALTTLTPTLLLATLLVTLTGFAHFLTDIPVTTIIQQRMPLGRMSACQSMWATASFGSESLSVGVTGLVLGLVTVPGGFMIAGGVLCLIGIGSLIKLRKNGHFTLDRRSLPE